MTRRLAPAGISRISEIDVERSSLQYRGYDVPSLGEIGNLLVGLAAAISAYQAWLAKRQSRKNSKDVIAVKETVNTVVSKIDEVQKQTNGLSHHMQEVARKEGRQEKADELLAEGVARGDAKRVEAVKDAEASQKIANMTGETVKPVDPA